MNNSPGAYSPVGYSKNKLKEDDVESVNFWGDSVPPGLCVINEKLPQLCKHTYIEEEEDIGDDIIDRLLELASVSEKQRRKTRKRNPVALVMVAGTRNKRKSRKQQGK